jgi:hypothetical protein
MVSSGIDQPRGLGGGRDHEKPGKYQDKYSCYSCHVSKIDVRSDHGSIKKEILAIALWPKAQGVRRKVR